MDLTKEYPRSPRARLLDIPGVPRMIDKARAQLLGTIGEYKYGEKSGNDRSVLAFLGLSADEFLEGVRQSHDDEAMAEWLRAHARPMKQADIERFGVEFVSDGDDDEDRRRFAERKAKLPANVQSRVTGWVDLLDFDEGRIA
jgi:hypothetical protein